MTDTVLIIDFGSQVTQLIARRVRETGVHSEIVPFNKAAEAFERIRPKAVILSGGPASVTADGSPRAPQKVFESGLPIVAICYGQQATAVQLGGTVEGGHAAEFGRAGARRVPPHGSGPEIRAVLEFVCIADGRSVAGGAAWSPG